MTIRKSLAILVCSGCLASLPTIAFGSGGLELQLRGDQWCVVSESHLACLSGHTTLTTVLSGKARLEVIPGPGELPLVLSVKFLDTQSDDTDALPTPPFTLVSVEKTPSLIIYEFEIKPENLRQRSDTTFVLRVPASADIQVGGGTPESLREFVRQFVSDWNSR